MDNGGTCLIILLLADPHLLEGGQGSQDGATNPDGVLTLRGSNDLEGGEEQTDRVRERGNERESGDRKSVV